MGNCLGADNYGGLSQGLVPSGGMQVGGPEKPVDPDDPWKDWYYNDYDQPAMVDGRMQSGRWDMSRESFAGKLEEKQRIQQSLAQKAQLDKANAALTAQRSARAGPSTPDQARQQSRALGGGAVGGPGTPGRPMVASPGAGGGAAGGMSQLQVLVVGNEIVPRDTPCVVAARNVAELGHQLRSRLRVPVEVRVLGFDADFGEWAQLEEGSISEIARQPGFKVKLTAKK